MGSTPAPFGPSMDPVEAQPTSAALDDGSSIGVCSVLMLRLVNVLVAPCILLALHSLMCFMHNAQVFEEHSYFFMCDNQKHKLRAFKGGAFNSLCSRGSEKLGEVKVYWSRVIWLDVG